MGLLFCYLFIFNVYLLVFLGYIRVVFFELSICIYYGKGVDYRLVLYYFNGFKVIYKYGECKVLKYCVL